MALSRRLLPLVSAGLVALPACVVSRSASDGPPARLAAAPPAADGPTEFASLIRGPGERVAAHDPDPAVMPRTVAASAVEPIPGPAAAGVPPVPEAPRFAPPPPPDPPLVAAVRAYADGRPEEAVGQLNHLDKPNQELMLQLIPTVVRLSQLDLARATPHELGKLAAPLEAAGEALAVQGPLGLDKVCFCRGANAFGVYEPYPDRHPFPPGTPSVALYAEVRNVRCEPAANPAEGEGFETKLALEVRVVDEAGAAVELPIRGRKPVPVLRDTERKFTRSQVRDCFVKFWVPVPTKPGSYGVMLEVREAATGRAVSKTVPLQVR